MTARTHQFFAIAFEENLSIKELRSAFPEAEASAHELYLPLQSQGAVWACAFDALVSVDVPAELREAQLRRLHEARPNLTTQVVREDYSVIEDPDAPIGVSGGVLRVDHLTPPRAAIVALTVAQSALAKNAAGLERRHLPAAGP